MRNAYGEMAISWDNTNFFECWILQEKKKKQQKTIKKQQQKPNPKYSWNKNIIIYNICDF